MAKKILSGQMLLPDPLEFTLRQACDQYHRRSSHSAAYSKSLDTALDHWERCTSNPAVSAVDNAVMADFSRTFLQRPLPSKVQILLRRARKGQAAALATLAGLGITAGGLKTLDDQAVSARIAAASCVPEELLPSSVTFNAQRRIIEAIFSTLGPKHRGNRYALGLLPDVPCCRPEEEAEPEVIYASEEDLNAIYRHCDAATWPDRLVTGVPPDLLWRAFFVFLYNVAWRRADWLQLDKSRVRLSEGVILSRQKKSGKFRATPINQTLVRHLRQIWNAQGPLLFPFPRNKRALYQTWYRIQESAGIRLDRADCRVREPYYGFHEIRKTSLGEYFCVSEHAAQQMGAHSDLATTLKHYVAAAKQTGKLRAAVDALPQPSAFLTGTDSGPPAGPAGPPHPHPHLRIVG